MQAGFLAREEAPFGLEHMQSRIPGFVAVVICIYAVVRHRLHAALRASGSLADVDANTDTSRACNSLPLTVQGKASNGVVP